MDLLQSIAFYRTYSQTKLDGSKETWGDTVDRVRLMHIEKFPELKSDIDWAFKHVLNKAVVPSMRSMQFAGYPIRRNNARIFNCSFLPLQDFQAFAELCYLLSSGCGVGYGIRSHELATLPPITEGGAVKFHTIPDTKEGWADAFRILLENPFVCFNFDEIRAKGSPLSTGGTASGPGPLMDAVVKIKAILQHALGRQITAVEASDVACLIADAIVCGGVRRSATIALFDTDDMLDYKSGNWWEAHPHRARANVSKVFSKASVSEQALKAALDYTFDSFSGEPGVVLLNDKTTGLNPCAEIALKPFGFCNLSEINCVVAINDFLNACRAAAIIGTLQASYTDFSYLRPEWKKNAEEEALLGVSLTGLAQVWHNITPELLQQGANVIKSTNKIFAEKLNIKPAARLTCVKPSGTTSATLGITSGIHAAHSPYYIRRIRITRDDPIAKYLISLGFYEDDQFSKDNIIASMPVKMTNALYRQAESAVELLNRSALVYENWIKPGHVRGEDTHNVSLTVSYKETEREDIKQWLWENRLNYTGVSLLPYDGGSYVQAPFEEIDEDTYNMLLDKVPQKINLTALNFSGTFDERQGELACAGGACEIK